MSLRVTVVDYDPRWPVLYEEERDLILSVVGEIIAAVEHIGSTAVPGLGGKPIIDIMAAVHSLADADRCIEQLEGIGFEYVPEHEVTTPERRYFRKGPQENHRHLHLVELRSAFWRDHLLFRDYLRSHPDVAQQYHQLKKELGAKHRMDAKAYTDAKASFIESVISRAEAMD